MQKKLLFILILFFTVCLCGCTIHNNDTSSKMHSASAERLNKIKQDYSETIKNARETNSTYTYNDDVLKINMY